MRLIKSILAVCFAVSVLYIMLYAADTWRTGRQNARLAAAVEAARTAEWTTGDAGAAAAASAALPKQTEAPFSQEAANGTENGESSVQALPQTTPCASVALPALARNTAASPTASPDPAVMPAPSAEPTAVRRDLPEPTAAQSASPGPVAQVTASPDPTNAAMLPEYAALAAQNPEMIGWIRIEDTRISYPVMQTPEDPQFYLHRGFDRAYAFEGVPFLDARCDPALPSDNLIIYGHNMRSGSMFGTLKEYLNEEFYLAHPLIQFDTLARRGVYRVFAVIPVVLGEMEDERMRCYGVSMTQDEEQLALLEEYVRRYAVLSSPQSLPAVGGEVITLSTCTGFRGANRLVVMAARERQEPGD